MLARDFKRVVIIVGPFLLLIYVGLRCLDWRDSASGLDNWFDHIFAPNWKQGDELEPHSRPAPSAAPIPSQPVIAAPPPATAVDQDQDTHHEVFSISTPDKKFFAIHLGQEQAINPNILPHPALDDTFIVVAQRRKQDDDSAEHVELVCNAVFTASGLTCIDPPSVLPIAPTRSGDKCPPELAYIALNVGPHDARVFHGPRAPFIVYGSNSVFACFGQFMQRLPALGDWGYPAAAQDEGFGVGTELQRPAPWGAMEKNWFLFWDVDGAAYVHHDIAPKRVFAKLDADGSVGPDLAPLAAAGDEACLRKHMPELPADLESIHQATNSLSITLCRKSDADCTPSGDNTFIFTVFQHKTFYHFHSEYEPYVMVFRQRAPFEVFAVSRRPVWIHGRERRGDRGSDMFYVTSVSWKAKGQRYHGYLDDVLFVSFGVEDQRTGAIDVLAEDLLADLGTCLEA